MCIRDRPEITATYRDAWHAVDETSTVMLAIWWAQRDPVSAFNEGHTYIRTSQNLWSATVVRIWARSAPDEALQAIAASQMPSMATEWSRSLRLALVRGWFDGEADPMPLLDYIRTLPVGRPVKETLDAFLERLVDARGIEQAVEIVEGIDAGDARGFRRDVFQRFATVLTTTDPQAAIDWASRHVETPAGELLYQRIARRWSRSDGPATLEWVMSWPDDPTRSRALLANYRIFLSRDGEGAIAWLDARPEDDTALRLLYRASVSYLARRGQPLEAIARAEAVEDAKRRENLLGTALGEWLATDQAAAERWIAERGPSEEVLREARKQQRGRRQSLTAAARANAGRSADTNMDSSTEVQAID